MEPADATTLDRPLRLLTCLVTAICIPLNIAATVLSLKFQGNRWGGRHVTAYPFSFVPLAITVTSVLLILDLVAIFGYIGTLIPCWALEIREFSAGGFGLLTGYVTTPMILSMFVHIYFVLKTVPWKKAFSSLNIWSKPFCQQCPNCQAKFMSGAAPPMTKKGYSLLRGEEYLDVEADPIQYRDSEDFLGEGAERAEQPEQAATAEDSGKSGDIMV
ncbi:hypothetical protein E8E11_010083 [Didymella keratinophila]|nr:hypothetical protein E8E11_010083 [Didymella keratinophila]